MNRVLSFRRCTALSIAIAMLAAPLGAQSFDTPPPGAAPAKAGLLSPAAFARLIQPPAGIAPSPAADENRRPDLLRQGKAVTARQARTTTAEPPRRRSAGWGTKTLAVVILVGAMAALMMAYYYASAEDS